MSIRTRQVTVSPQQTIRSTDVDLGWLAFVVLAHLAVPVRCENFGTILDDFRASAGHWFTSVGPTSYSYAPPPPPYKLIQSRRHGPQCVMGVLVAATSATCVVFCKRHCRRAPPARSTESIVGGLLDLYQFEYFMQFNCFPMTLAFQKS